MESTSTVYDFCEKENVDFLNTDKEYWRLLFKKIRDEIIFVQYMQYNDRYKFNDTKEQRLKRIRYWERYDKKVEWRGWSLFDRYGKECSEWIISKIKEMENGLGACIDNHRVANWRISKEVRWYNECRRHGCCGFADHFIEHKEFGLFKIGCNYGH